MKLRDSSNKSIGKDLRAATPYRRSRGASERDGHVGPTENIRTSEKSGGHAPRSSTGAAIRIIVWSMIYAAAFYMIVARAAK